MSFNSMPNLVVLATTKARYTTVMWRRTVIASAILKSSFNTFLHTLFEFLLGIKSFYSIPLLSSPLILTLPPSSTNPSEHINVIQWYHTIGAYLVVVFITFTTLYLVLAAADKRWYDNQASPRFSSLFEMVSPNQKNLFDAPVQFLSQTTVDEASNMVSHQVLRILLKTERGEIVHTVPSNTQGVAVPINVITKKIISSRAPVLTHYKTHVKEIKDGQLHYRAETCTIWKKGASRAINTSIGNVLAWVDILDSDNFRRADDSLRSLMPWEFTWNRVLGRGSYGDVVQINHLPTGALLAVKRINKTQEDLRTPVASEIHAHQLLEDFKSFPTLFGAFRDDDGYTLIMPAYQRGTVFDIMTKNEGRLPAHLLSHYGAGLLLGIQFMHRQGIIHRDLKPTNFLVDDGLNLVIADFGVAKVFTRGDIDEEERRFPHWRDMKKLGGDCFPLLWPMDNPDTTLHACGTPEYCAPEVFNKHEYSYGVDLWSFGVNYYQMLTGKYPFRVDNERRVIHDLSFLEPGKREIELDAKDAAYFAKIFNPVPTERSTIYELKCHPAFKRIDWKKLTKAAINQDF